MACSGDILLVEDNPGDVRLFEEAAAETDLDVNLHVFSSGQAALDLLHQENECGESPAPDATLLDWNLPNVDAEDILYTIKENYQNIPVVIITGSETYVDVVRDEAIQADDCLYKPADPGKYDDLLQRCIELCKQ